MWWPRIHRRSGLTAIVGEGCELEGRCRFTGVVMLDGRVDGDLVIAETLIVGGSATITAAIQATTVIVRGTIRGDVTASERVELMRSARVVGDIDTPILTVEDGARVEGHCRSGRERDDAQLIVVPLGR